MHLIVPERQGEQRVLQMALLERFPEEGGQKDPNKRIMPFLPGKVLFQRSHTKEVTLKRLQKVTEYCEALNKLPEKISQCDIIKNFFQASYDDSKHYAKRNSSNATALSQSIQSITAPLELEAYVAIADYKAEENTQVDLSVGELVDVVEKNENGWWLVCNVYGLNGWVPGAYLENPDGNKEDVVTERLNPGEGIRYRATCSYNANSEDEISFPAGGILEVMERNFEGWWFAKYNDLEGWVPGSYLQKHQPDHDVISIESLSLKTRERKPAPRRSTIRRQLPSRVSQNKRSYITLHNFKANINGGMSFNAGEKVQVLEQSDNGWWYVAMRDKEGWVPESYLSTCPDFDFQTIQSDHAPSRCSLSSAALSPTNSSLTPPDNISLDNPPEYTPLSKKIPIPLLCTIPSKELNETRKSNSSSLQGKWNVTHRTTDVVRPCSGREEYEAGKIVIDSTLSSIQTEPRTFSQRSTSLQRIVGKPIGDEKWFRNIARAEAENLLRNKNEEGCFVIRPSTKGDLNNPYSLTLMHRNIIFNFHIRLRNDGLYATGAYSDGEKTFKTVSALVAFYKTNTLVVGDYTNLVKLTGSP